MKAFLPAVQLQLSREHAGIVLAVSAGVTVARIALQRAWRPFQEASKAANDQAGQLCQDGWLVFVTKQAGSQKTLVGLPKKGGGGGGGGAARVSASLKHDQCCVPAHTACFGTLRQVCCLLWACSSSRIAPAQLPLPALSCFDCGPAQQWSVMLQCSQLP